MRYLHFLLLFSSLLFSVAPKLTTTMSMQELKKITLSDGGTGNQFGIAVATDGDIVVITALYNVNEDNTRGAAYIYEKDSKTGLYKQSAKLTTSDTSTIYNDNFGASIAISDNTIVVGAPLNTTDGSVYIYEKPALGWVDATQSAKLTSSERASSDRFGSAVAISGNVIVVGAFGTRGEVGTGNIGSAYIYVNYNRNWVDMTETAILTSSIRGNNHYFGESVAIDGDTVIVGASGTDTGFNNSGTVYLYEKPTSGWISSTENVKLTASNAAYNTRLGTSVSISNDIIVVGALGYLDYNAHSSAAVYLYEKSREEWIDANESARLTPSDQRFHVSFARRVVIDNDTVIASAYTDDKGLNAGAIYVYKKPTNGWISSTQNTKLTASDGNTEDYFAVSMAINGDILVAGAFLDDDLGNMSGSAYIFQNAIAKNMIENTKDIITLGASDSDGDDPIEFSLLSGLDSTFLSVNSSTGLLSFKVAPNFENPQDSDTNNTYEANIKITDTAGESETYAAYIRVNNIENENTLPKAISFKELNKITASNDEANNRFGFSTAIFDTTLVIGAWGYQTYEGRAYVYEYNATLNLFEEVAILKSSTRAAHDRLGFSVAISEDTIVLGATLDGVLDAGSAFVYIKPESGWVDAVENVKLTASDGLEYDYFAFDVAISNDTIVVGASSNDKSGSAYIFEKPSSGWVNATQNAKLKSSDGAEDDRFGHKVAMNENTIVISAYKHDSLGVESGAVYVYEKPVQGWVSAIENAKLTASDGNTNDYFGTDIDISGDTIVVGALLNDDSGCAYVFEKPIRGYWVSTGENAKLTASDNLPDDYFAFSVAISEESIVIGAYANDGTGSIYIYDKDNAWESATQNAKLTASNANNDDRFGESVAISADTIVVGGSYSYDRSAYIFKAKEENAINPSIIMYLLN